MKLKNAARYFDDDKVYDAYSGTYLWKAQFSSFEGASPDGSFVRRRTVSVAPEVKPAPRRVVKVQNDLWIMGSFMTDTFKGRPIRQSCSAKIVNGSFNLLSPGNAALQNYSEGVQIHGFARYLKDTVNSNTDSDYDPFYDVSFSETEVVPDGYFLRSAQQYFHIRSSQLLTDGFVNAACDEMALDSSAVKNCEVSVVLSGERDPVTELFDAGTVTTGLLLDMYKLYNYQTQADDLNKAGDMSLVLANTTSIYAGQVLTIGVQPWRIVGYTAYFDAWNVHVRRA